MAEVSVHTEVTRGRAADPFVLRLPPGALVLGCVLAAAPLGAAATALSPGSSIVSINSALAPEFAQAGAVAPIAGTQPSFFGYLEFDWDPNAPGGVPGFDPQHHSGTTPSQRSAMDRRIKQEGTSRMVPN